MKIGLCFAGGGARGAYQVGCCKALEELGLLQQVYAFSGTSIGSVNASLIATTSPDAVRDLWFSLSKDDMKKTENMFKRILKEKMDFIDNGAYDMTVLKKLLEEHLDFDCLRQKKVFVTVSEAGEWGEGLRGLLKASYLHYIKKDRKAHYSPIHEMDRETIINQILASCSIPIAFSPRNIDGKRYYDGGLYDNNPVTPLIEAGCNVIIVLHLHRIEFLDPNHYPEQTIIEIKHHKGLGGILNFDPEQAKILYHLGYQDIYQYFENHPLIN